MGRDPILIVDDNPTTLKLLRVVLTTESYDIQTANTSEEAFQVLEGFRPRLVLTDIQLPGMDGLEFTRRLKSNPATRDIIVLAITAYSMAGDEERVLWAGCSGYVTKPVDTRTLPATLKMHLERRDATRPAFTSGDYHDMLTDLRTSFLIEGEEEGCELLRALNHGFDLDRAQRIAHRWAGIAGTLGFPEIVETAHSIEEFLGNPSEQVLRAPGVINADECVSRLRADLLTTLRLFSDAIRGKRATPGLPPAIRDVLADKGFDVIGFEPAEASRIKRGLMHAHARAHIFEEPPDLVALGSADAVVVNLCGARSVSWWVQTRSSVVGEKPILFVGTAETLLQHEPEILQRRCNFLLGPWDTNELVLRAARLLWPTDGRLTEWPA
jgi:two-component system, cell cycle response regulator DivK